MLEFLPYIQIILAIILVIAILIQQSEGGLGGAFGGGEGSNTVRTKRGFEKTIFQFTIAVSVLFCLSVFASLLL